MEKMLVINGVGLSTVIGFVAEVGDLGRFTDPSRYKGLPDLKMVHRLAFIKR